MYTCNLQCGTVLFFEHRSFLPGVGERFPCRRHGYCRVAVGGLADGEPQPGRPRVARSPRRSPDELVEFLRKEPSTTVHALRRRRFTLRTLAAAAEEGLVDLDLAAGRVVARQSVTGAR